MEQKIKLTPNTPEIDSHPNDNWKFHSSNTKQNNQGNIQDYFYSGAPARIFSSTEQSYSSSYYTGTYTLSTSVDGVTFDYVNSANSTSTNSTRAVGNILFFIIFLFVFRKGLTLIFYIKFS